MNLCCFFLEHRKKYVALFQAKDPDCAWGPDEPCNGGNHPSYIVARWYCERCGKMGENRPPFGTWKIEFGKLVPDFKAWANPRSPAKS